MEQYQNSRKIARRAVIVFALLGMQVFSLLWFPVFAADAPAGPRPPDSEAASLNLTAAQQQKLAALEKDSRAQTDQLIAQIKQLRGKLSDLYGKYDFGVSGVAEARKMNQDLNHVQGQLLELRLLEQLQLRKILSAEQFASLQASIHRQGFPGDHRPHEPGGGPGSRNWEAR